MERHLAKHTLSILWACILLGQGLLLSTWSPTHRAAFLPDPRELLVAQLAPSFRPWMNVSEAHSQPT